jgi:2-keto-4-pentenoate hydratase/2-oxohepta-3-ene-1,7-dioic acid hydratase in catechol pathway
MKLVNYTLEGESGIGILDGDGLLGVSLGAHNIGESEIASIRTVDQLIFRGLLPKVLNLETKIKESAPTIDQKKAKIQSPILNPEKIFLAAVNYSSHGKEQNVEPPKEPYFFTKFRNTIIGNDDPILVPRVSKKVDWEVELCVVIGKRGKYIPAESAGGYIAGYTIADDISFRDLQFPEGWPERHNVLGQNWVKGKGLDGALPLGPCLVTRDEIGSPYELDLSLSVNGRVHQRSNTREMIFKVEELIEYLSAGITLEPGDLISTGTPLGVAAFTGAPYLKDGDFVEAKISKIGTLRNSVVSE